MIKLENTEVVGWEHAIRGMRNPMNSWEKSDGGFGCRLNRGRDHVNWEQRKDGEITYCKECTWCGPLCDYTDPHNEHREFIIGPNDHELMMKLAKGGSVHAKYRRMITVYVDITAPLYWWKEFDTYKVGTVANSCSTMHKIHAKPLTVNDFSCSILGYGTVKELAPHYKHFTLVIDSLNNLRDLYLKTKDKIYWDAMIQMLPSSYNQKRTIMMNYEVLTNIYESRKNHKLYEWHAMCDWIKSLPYSEIITGEVEGDEKSLL